MTSVTAPVAAQFFQSASVSNGAREASQLLTRAGSFGAGSRLSHSLLAPLEATYLKRTGSGVHRQPVGSAQ